MSVAESVCLLHLQFSNGKSLLHFVDIRLCLRCTNSRSNCILAIPKHTTSVVSVLTDPEEMESQEKLKEKMC